MSNIGRNVVYGVLGAATTRVARRATRRAMHTDRGTPKLPVAARRRSGLGMALAWAAGAGAVMAIADVLKEQRKDTTERS
jgi:hypothetical protein